MVGIDLFTEPGKYHLDITVRRQHGYTARSTVSKKEYPVQRLTLPKDMVELRPRTRRGWSGSLNWRARSGRTRQSRIWDGEFINPREGKISTLFGVRRFINKIPKSPHTGVDVEAKKAIRAGAEQRRCQACR